MQVATERFLTLRQQGGCTSRPAPASSWIGWAHYIALGSAPDAVDDLKDENKALPFPELLYKLRIDWQGHAQGGAA